ncbi:DUF4912 domain-containing protein [Pelotomaculum propionicicum]|uniref:DUF4912 domain-containing protein n=1 Tax=Pelotomaculum propionicicum TaxID=258475 RepID=UPI003B77A55B
MEKQGFKKVLPAEYHENALILMFQSPKVLYAYWELSPGLRNTLSGKKNVQIRLNINGKGIIQVFDFDLTKKSYYFENVIPGKSYNCEIGTLNEDNIFLPLLRSNIISAPHDLPGSVSPGEANSPSSSVFKPEGR